MANANRYYKTPFAESGNKAEVPNVSVGGAVGYDSGFGPDYELPQGSPSRKRIERDLYNGMHFGITKNLKQWQENLYPTWIEDDGTGVAFAYEKGMIVNHAGQDWVSTEDANQEEPGTGSKWEVFTPFTPSKGDQRYTLKLEAVARSLNVTDNKVTSETAGEVVSEYIYSATQEKTYHTPLSARGSTIILLDSFVLTTTTGEYWLAPSTQNAKQNKMFEDRKLLTFAHRGDEINHPENTLTAFQASTITDGYEVDLHITSDGEWVVIHDDTLDRTTDGTGLVSSKTLAEIKALDAGSWFSSYFSGARVPSLTEFLVICKTNNMIPLLEMKAQGDATQQQLLIDQCKNILGVEGFCITSLSSFWLRQIRAKDKDVRLGVYTANPNDAYINEVLQLSPCVAMVNIDNLNASIVDDFHSNNIPVHTYTLQTGTQHQQAIEMGVDGLITANMQGAKL